MGTPHSHNVKHTTPALHTQSTIITSGSSSLSEPGPSIRAPHVESEVTGEAGRGQPGGGGGETDSGCN